MGELCRARDCLTDGGKGCIGSHLQLVMEWYDKKWKVPPDTTVPDLIARVIPLSPPPATVQPDATLVVVWTDALTNPGKATPLAKTGTRAGEQPKKKIKAASPVPSLSASCRI